MQPKAVFDFFKEINQIPRPSKHEEKMIAYLKGVAEANGLEYHIDEVGNVIIYCPATPGYEDAQTTVIQSHMDMVCEKNKDLEFDFLTQPINSFVDGEWLKAKGTTLGADDGIGCAMQLAIATDKTINHGPLELLFTTDEESGMTGAFGLKKGLLKGKYLINLDSEDEGEFFIGCAGGETANITFEYNTLPLEKDFIPIKIEIDKFRGGHSGDEINKNRANAIKVLSRFLFLLWRKYDARLIELTGGKLHNAIPRFSEAVVAVPLKDKEQVRVDFNVFASEIENEYHVEEKEASFKLSTIEQNELMYVQPEVARNLIFALQGIHNGILEMNQDIEGLVETSSNLASITQENGIFKIITSHRSSTESALHNMSNTIASVFELAGAKVVMSDKYPGWQPNTQTKLLKVSVESYGRLFGKKPVVRAIHAGLECGLFSTKYPEMEMISFGPTLRDVHTPLERILIPTVDMAWKLLLDILSELK